MTKRPTDINILANVLDKLDRVAEKYEKTHEPEDLAEYLWFRDRYLRFHEMCWLGDATDSDTAFKMMCYDSMLFRRLGFRKSDPPYKAEDVKLMMEWRETIRASKVILGSTAVNNDD